MITKEKLESISLEESVFSISLPVIRSIAKELIDARKIIEHLRRDIVEPSPDIQEHVLKTLRMWPGLCAAGQWMNYPESKPSILGGEFIVECEMSWPGIYYRAAYFTEDGFKSQGESLDYIKRFAEILP